VRERDAVVSWMAAMSQRAPVLLILDDLHRAGPALLMLVGGLFTTDDPIRVLVLATARCSAAEHSSRLEQLVRRVAEQDALDRIDLDGVSLASVQRLLTELGIPEADFDAAELAALTQGHPGRLGERLRDHVISRS